MFLSGEPPFSLVVLFCFCILISTVDYADGFSTQKQSLVSTSSTRPSSLFAKTKGGGKKKKPHRAVAQGFGAPPPQLEDVLATFKVGAPEGADALPCPCGAGRSYDACCGPLHRGERPCATMTEVLRSRYAAFAWRIIPHVMRTTHPSCRDYREDRVAWGRDLNQHGMFDSFEFVKLEAGEEELSPDEDNEGFMDFKVTLRAKGDGNSAVAGQETVISERSTFLRNPEDGSWSYASGDVRSDVVGLEDTTLNA